MFKWAWSDLAIAGSLTQPILWDLKESSRALGLSCSRLTALRSASKQWCLQGASPWNIAVWVQAGIEFDRGCAKWYTVKVKNPQVILV